MRTGVEPGGAAAEEFDAESAGVEVEPVEVRDLEFTALGRFEGARDFDDISVVEIDAGDGVVGFRLRGFFLKGEDATIGSELDDAVAGGVGDVVAKNGGSGGAGPGGFERAREIMAVEKVVAEDEGRGFGAGEEAGVAGDVEGLGEAVGAGLLGVGELEAEVGAVAEQFFKEREIGGGGDDEDLANAGEHQDRQRVIDHRFIVNRHELLGDGDGEGPEARAGASCKNYPATGGRAS